MLKVEKRLSSGRLGFNYKRFSGITSETKAKYHKRLQGWDYAKKGRQGTSCFCAGKFCKTTNRGYSKYAKDYSQAVIAAKAEKDPVSVEVSLISKAGGIYTGRATLTSDKATQSILE